MGLLLLLFTIPPCVAVATTTTCNIGTRPSPLAMVQAKAVAQVLQAANPSLCTNIVPISAAGDISGQNKENTSVVLLQDQPLALQQADFTGALDQALNEGKIDVAVHSFKDIPPNARWQYSEDFAWMCPLPRENPVDVLVGAESLESLLLKSQPRIKIGTSSIRRQAQLRHQLRTLQQQHAAGMDNNNTISPALELVNLRGNLETRLSVLNEGVVDALVLAKAGLKRLGIVTNDNKESSSLVISELPTDIILPGLCQGIVAAVYRKSDPSINAWTIPQDHSATMAAHAERAFLNALDEISPWTGRPPLAGLLEQQNGGWKFRGLLARPDGTRVLRVQGSLPVDASELDAASLGTRLGLELKDMTGSNFLNE